MFEHIRSVQVYLSYQERLVYKEQHIFTTRDYENETDYMSK